jgi:dipeptidase E
MIKLILAGGGNNEDSKLIDKFFVNLIPKNKKMLYIPVAMSESRIPHKQCFEWIKSTFRPFNFTDIEMWEDLNNKKYSDLEKFGAIYIGGGNTFSLLNDLRNSGFIDLLKKFIRSGKLVYGGSAGAIIMGKSIETASFGDNADKNFVNLKDLSGLNLINNHNVQCHYKEGKDKEIITFVNNTGFPIIAIHEQTSLYIEDKKMKVIGFKPVYVFRKGGKIAFKPNSLFSL